MKNKKIAILGGAVAFLAVIASAINRKLKVKLRGIENVSFTNTGKAIYWDIYGTIYGTKYQAEIQIESPPPKNITQAPTPIYKFTTSKGDVTLFLTSVIDPNLDRSILYLELVDSEGYTLATKKLDYYKEYEKHIKQVN